MTVVLNFAPFVTLPDYRFTAFGKNIHIPSVNKFTNRSLGWPDYAAHIDRARKSTGATLLIADHYSTVSLAEFYLPDHPVIYQPTGMHPQFELWGGYKSKLQSGERALFITTNEQQPLVLKGNIADEFGAPELVDDFYTREQGRDIKRFRIFLLTAK
jgi:hypothetical protein